MTESLRISTETYDGGGGVNSIVDQTTDIINRFRNSIVRSRKERLLDEDIHATENIVNQLHFTELISKETLGKLILQSDSMQRSYHLINQLEKEIKQIAEDLNQVNGNKFWNICSNRTFCGCLMKKKKEKRKKNQQIYSNQLKTIEQNRLVNLQFNLKYFLYSFNQSFATEREEMVNKTRDLSKERRKHPNFIEIINQLNDIKNKEKENNEKKLNKFRDYLLENHSLSYGYIDEPDRLMTEINMSIHFTELNTHLDHLLQMTNVMNNEINENNLIISKIESQAMESGNLLTDYTLLGHHILGSSPTHLQTLTNNNTITSDLNTLGISTGQKLLLNSVL